MRGDKVVVVKREAVADYVDYLVEDKKKKKGVVACVGGGAVSGKKGSGGGGGSMRCCQAEKCNADLREAKQYHRRHKVCEYHAKAQVVLVAGMRQRFCQQCSRFGRIGSNFVFCLTCSHEKFLGALRVL